MPQVSGNGKADQQEHLTFEREKRAAPGHKSSKECLMFMCCGNATMTVQGYQSKLHFCPLL
jgi:hypothetical protein